MGIKRYQRWMVFLLVAVMSVSCFSFAAYAEPVDSTAVPIEEDVPLGGEETPTESALSGELDEDAGALEKENPDKDAAADALLAEQEEDGAKTSDAGNAPDYDYLSDLEWKSASVGWGSANRDLAADGSALRLNGTTYSKGIGVHAYSRIVYDLGGDYQRFYALTGISDGKVTDANQAGLKFQVYGDGELLYDGPNITRKGSVGQARPVPVDIDVSGVETLELVAANIIPDTVTSNHANWADARVYKTAEGLPQLDQLQVDGSPIPGFDPEKTLYEYEISVEDLGDINDVEVPRVSGEGEHEVRVVQAQSVPGEAYVTVEDGTSQRVYTVRFSLQDTAFVSDLEWTAATSSNNNKICKKDTNVLGNRFGGGTSHQGAGPITIGGTIDREYAKGIGSYGESSVVIPLDGAYTTFYADVGLDRLVSHDSSIVMDFVVLGDGRELASVTGVSYDDPNWSANHFAVDVTDVDTLEIVTRQTGGTVSDVGNAVANWGNARLATVAVDYTGSTKLASITLNGVVLGGFSPGLTDYAVVLPTNTVLPEISYIAQDSGATVAVAYDPEDRSIPNTTTLTVNNGDSQSIYTIAFGYGEDEATLTLDRTKLNPLLDENPYITLSTEIRLADGTFLTEDDPQVESIRYFVQTLRTSGDGKVAELEGNRIFPVRNDKAQGMDKAYNGGTARVTVEVALTGGAVLRDEQNITVRPFYIDYSKTITAKMQLQTGDNSISMNFADVLEAVQRYDNLTNGIPKVIYLVGWQGHGHDSDYPSWDQVNESLAIEGMSGRDSLIYVMNEAKKYNTVLSLHANVTSTAFGSPLYSLYNAKDIWGRRADGATTVYGGGGMVSYYMEWESYLLQQRTDRLLELLPPLVEGGTMHFDAFHLRVPSAQSPTAGEFYISEYQTEKYGFSTWDEIDAMRNIFWYWRELGLDVTAEATTGYRRDPAGNSEAFIGLQPMAWNFGQSGSDWNMNIPADLYTGGQNGADRFGKSYKIESGATGINENNMLNGLQNFMIMEVPFLYLNCFERVADSGGIVTFSDGVTSKNPEWIKQGDKYFRDGNDIFIPAIFKGEDTKEIMMYTANGYTDKVWALPDDWDGVTAVDLYKLSTKLPEKIQQDIAVTDGTILLTLPGATNVAYVVVPAGAEYVESLRQLVQVTDLVVETEALTLDAGDVKVLDARVVPANATDRGIRYTSSDPAVATVSVAGKITALSEGTTVITAKTTDGEIEKTCEVTVNGTVHVPAPTTSVPSGSYREPQKIRLSCADEQLDIYYTLDGTEPIIGLSHYYTENDDPQGLALSATPAPIEAGDDLVIKAIAVKDGYLASDVATFTYRIADKQVTTPMAGIPSGKYTVQQRQALQVYLSTWTPETRIYYTIDGSEPDEGSPQYLATAPLFIGKDTTLKVRAYKDGMQPSDVSVFDYEISPATGNSWTNPVAASHLSGVYKADKFPFQVELTPLRPGTEIRYTTDGSTPTKTSPVYTGPITVTDTMTIKALCNESPGNLTISTFQYVSDKVGQVENPTASLPSGTYEEGTVITLSCGTSGSSIYYTLNGLAPNGANSRWLQIGNEFSLTKSRFSREIVLDKTTTVRVVAAKNGMRDSEVVTYTYQIGEEPDPGEVVEVEKVAIEAPTSLKRKKAVQLTAVLTPSDATHQEVTWEVLNPAVATISPDGLLTAGASTGFVFVKATAHNGVSAQVMIEITM